MNYYIFNLNFIYFTCYIDGMFQSRFPLLFTVFDLVAFAVDWVVFRSVIQPLSYDSVTCVLNREWG